MIQKVSIRTILGLVLMVGIAEIVAGNASTNPDPFVPNSSGIRQITEISKRLTKAMGDIPPEMERIAIYQIRTDARDFSPGMARYIQAQVEEIFRREGHRTIVNSPELKTFRVISTDTTFKFTNAAPSMEDLWKLGDKLRVDGFIEGSCSKSPDNDVILNLKLFKHRTGDVLWSASFVAGPNEKNADPWELKWSASGDMRFFPIKTAILPRDDSVDQQNNFILDTLSSITLTQYGVEVTVSEAVTQGRWLYFSLSAGYGFATSGGGPDSISNTFSISTVKLGIELLGIFFQKPNPELGYWLGTYVSFQEFIPLLNHGHLDAIGIGYKSQISRHFSLGGGILFLPFNKNIRGMYASTDRFLTLSPIAYDLTYLHYTF